MRTRPLRELPPAEAITPLSAVTRCRPIRNSCRPSRTRPMHRTCAVSPPPVARLCRGTARSSRNTPNAYWSYLQRYPNGPHAADARRRLSRLSAQAAPPPNFAPTIYEDLPPPRRRRSFTSSAAVPVTTRRWKCRVPSSTRRRRRTSGVLRRRLGTIPTMSTSCRPTVRRNRSG